MKYLICDIIADKDDTLIKISNGEEAFWCKVLALNFIKKILYLRVDNKLCGDYGFNYDDDITLENVDPVLFDIVLSRFSNYAEDMLDVLTNAQYTDMDETFITDEYNGTTEHIVVLNSDTKKEGIRIQHK